ncbi:MAG: hypothetical protein HN707_10220 [Verrucomicrobia bacterium]|nr:hypothetical protein [Verrucomicrobiota bacterium]MBT4900398.1 hypothetical protein [Verrucomicrobiota bacterium]MBT6661343.1 hypothetical protein [Verrucomicrobiota bacterium]MBT7735273.1 hypothetical protein [Verrucomicrobiota bacterium]MBT7911287.1 hypothetical protein [Verrucomicrobiota bacterium]
MANGFTEWLNIGLPGQPILAEAQDLFGLVFLLIAALVGWINKRKDASKLEQASHAVPTQRSQRPAPAQAGKPTGWLARLEQLAQTQLDQTDRESESHYDDNYEQESVDLPPVIGADAPVTPALVGSTQEAYRDTPLTNQLREAEQASVTRKTASGRSPVYDSPIYTGNIAHHIGTDLRAAQQAVVGSIILGAPKSLESPGQVNRQ